MFHQEGLPLPSDVFEIASTFAARGILLGQSNVVCTLPSNSISSDLRQGSLLQLNLPIKLSQPPVGVLHRPGSTEMGRLRRESHPLSTRDGHGTVAHWQKSPAGWAPPALFAPVRPWTVRCASTFGRPKHAPGAFVRTAAPFPLAKGATFCPGRVARGA